MGASKNACMSVQEGRFACKPHAKAGLSWFAEVRAFLQSPLHPPRVHFIIRQCYKKRQGSCNLLVRASNKRVSMQISGGGVTGVVSRGGIWAGDKVYCVAEEGIIFLGLRGWGCRRWGFNPCRLKGCTARGPCVYQGRAAQDARMCHWFLAVEKLPNQDEECQPMGSQV